MEVELYPRTTQIEAQAEAVLRTLRQTEPWMDLATCFREIVGADEDTFYELVCAFGNWRLALEEDTQGWYGAYTALSDATDAIQIAEAFEARNGPYVEIELISSDELPCCRSRSADGRPCENVEHWLKERGA